MRMPTSQTQHFQPKHGYQHKVSFFFLPLMQSEGRQFTSALTFADFSSSQATHFLNEVLDYFQFEGFSGIDAMILKVLTGID